MPSLLMALPEDDEEVAIASCSNSTRSKSNVRPQMQVSSSASVSSKRKSGLQHQPHFLKHQKEEQSQFNKSQNHANRGHNHNTNKAHSSFFQHYQDNRFSRFVTRILQKTVLKPHYSIRRQLFLSFGTTAFLAISFFVVIGIVGSDIPGRSVMGEARQVQNELARRTLGLSSRYVAETMTKRFDNLRTASDILVETTRDRIVGYKGAGFTSLERTDQYVPFMDVDSGQAMYPLKTPDLMQLDWNITSNLNDDNVYTHYQGREQWYQSQPGGGGIASTAHAAYFMQGTCNPQASINSPDYYPNCTANHNSIVTGGVVRPSPVNYFLATKSADIVFMLKALYEAHVQVKQLGVYFANGGAGSYITFPATMRNASAAPYEVSVVGGKGGCDWLRRYINPLTNNFIATQEEWSRCTYRNNNNLQQQSESEKETEIPSRIPQREFNPLHRSWCIRQAIAPPGKMVSTGPYLDASTSFVSSNRSGNGEKNDDDDEAAFWVITFGHGIFDRKTKEFIGCTLVDVHVQDLRDSLNMINLGDSSSVALVRWDNENDEMMSILGNPNNNNINNNNNTYYNTYNNTYNNNNNNNHNESHLNRAGTVVTCGKCEWDKQRRNPFHITELQSDFGVDEELFREMQQLVDYSQPWEPGQLKAIYNQTLFRKNGQLVMIYPVPYLPPRYDPHYKPDFMIIMAISEEEIFGQSDAMDEVITSDMRVVIRDISLIGLGGLAIIFVLLAWISSSLSKPLLWMQATTAQVINNAGSDDLAAGTNNMAGSSAAGQSRCAPETEVTVLLSEFEMMMDGFSGQGAAEIADSKVSEVENKFQWREVYQVLYPYDFRTSNNTDATDDSDGEDAEDGQTPADFVSVNTQRTFLSTLTEYSFVKALKQPYEDLTTSLSKSVSSLAQASITAGIEKLPGWAQSMVLKSDDEDDTPDYVVAPPKVNLGENIRSSKTHEDDEKRLVEVSSSSRVFWWVTLCIGIPILLTATFIVTMTGVSIRGNMDKWLADVKTSSYLLEKDAVNTATLSRAAFGSEVMSRFIRDLHIYSRTAGWLLFGGLQRSESINPFRSGAEECKYYSTDANCPFKTREVPCDCAWNDNYAAEGKCTNYAAEGIDSRYLQTNILEGPKSDIDPLGNRRETSFPNISTSPESTSWWVDPKEMPGSYQGVSASGYASTHDRVRVLSALSTVHFPLYNYFPGVDEKVHLGAYVGLDADGMMIGYVGCGDSHADYAHQKATKENRMSVIAPLICPENQYGYDCRCRGWFVSATDEDVYISPPYQFAASERIGTSAATALRDPETSELVAVALLDFLPTAFTNALGPEKTVIGNGDRGFPLVITPNEDIFGGNTLIGPDYDLTTDGPQPIQNVTLPQDDEGTANREEFKRTVESMEKGLSGHTTFVRTAAFGEETIYLSYAPVNVHVLMPLNHSDFSAGCNISSKLVYSLGIAVADADLYLRYQLVENDVDQQLKTALALSIAAMLVLAISFTILTYYISLNIIRPIIALTKIVKSIKNKSLRDEIPNVEGGSREVNQVHESFQRLMKVVRFANTAFFAGDRTQSMHYMEDALNLFLTLGNQKAIGVANNNLGTMVLQEQMESHGTDRLFDNSLFGICISEIYFVGINYFDEAIRHGSFEYEISKETDDQASYAKQLANRHFNRGMFLVVVRHHPLAPSWIHEDGVSDLLRAKDLDLEVLQLLHKQNQFKAQEVQEFESLLRRTRGILSLVRNYGFQDPWGIDSLIDQAETLLNEAGKFTSNLFKAMNAVGRRQQIDDLKIQHALCQKDYATAGKIATRMLVEDEYIIDTTIVNAITAVDRYFKQEKIRVPTVNATQYLARDTRKAQVNVLREAKNVFFCLDYSGSMAGERMKRANANLRWVYDEHCSDKDYVGFIRFNHDIDDKLWFPLGKKGDWAQVQEAVLALATDAEGGTRLYAALNRCVTQIQNTETKNDTWIIALTDGESSWDHPAKRVVERIKKLNKQRTVKIHVIIIGFEVPESVIKTCEGVTSVTDKSLYVDARGGLDEMDKAFEQVVSVIGGSAITMETF